MNTREKNQLLNTFRDEHSPKGSSDYSEQLLDEADEFARRNTVYYSGEELSRKIKEKYNIDDSRSSISMPQDLNGFWGSLKHIPDGLDLQRRMREEWE